MIDTRRAVAHTRATRPAALGFIFATALMDIIAIGIIIRLSRG